MPNTPWPNDLVTPQAWRANRNRRATIISEGAAPPPNQGTDDHSPSCAARPRVAPHCIQPQCVTAPATVRIQFISSGVGARTRLRNSFITAPYSLKFFRASSRLTWFAPPAYVGLLNCTSSSSQKHTGQIINVPGGFSSCVRKPQHGHAYRDALIAHPPPAGSSRLSRPSVGKAFVLFRWLSVVDQKVLVDLRHQWRPRVLLHRGLSLDAFAIVDQIYLE